MENMVWLITLEFPGSNPDANLTGELKLFLRSSAEADYSLNYTQLF